MYASSLLSPPASLGRAPASLGGAPAALGGAPAALGGATRRLGGGSSTVLCPLPLKTVNDLITEILYYFWSSRLHYFIYVSNYVLCCQFSLADFFPKLNSFDLFCTLHALLLKPNTFSCIFHTVCFAMLYDLHILNYSHLVVY